MKKQAISERRVQFENARRIIFGTDLIPGTNRERWTTAGMFKPTDETNMKPFTLGSYRFIKAGNRIYLDTDNALIFITIIKNYISISWPKLSRVSSNLSDTWERQKSQIYFQHENKIYFNASFSKDVTTSISGVKPPALTGRVLPNDDEKLIEHYKKTKNATEIDFQLFWGAEDIPILTIPPNEIPEGIAKYQDITCIFSAGLVGLQVGVTGVVPWQHVKPYFTKSSNDICEYENVKFWYYNDIVYIAEAIDWLMHVLTGPDPRNYDARPFDNQDVPLKEDSEPRKRYFTFEKDQYDIYHMKGSMNPVYFVLDGGGGIDSTFDSRIANDRMTIIDAKLIRNTTIRLLREIEGSANFPKHYANFMAVENYRDLPYSRTLFNAAIARIDRFDQYEYLGCAVCGEESSKKCGNCNQLYCGEKCQKLHWEQGHRDKCQ
jgi:hypothetical protein